MQLNKQSESCVTDRREWTVTCGAFKMSHVFSGYEKSLKEYPLLVVIMAFEVGHFYKFTVK